MEVSTAKAAAKTALGIIEELIPDAESVSLEGIELDSEKNVWKVIVGFIPHGTIQVGMMSALASINPRSQREYRQIELDGETLELTKMVPYDVAA